VKSGQPGGAELAGTSSNSLVGSLGGHIQILENDGPLILELFPKHEIESVVGHPKHSGFGMHCMIPLSRRFLITSTVQCMSGSRKSDFNTGRARSRSTGCPMRATLRIDMLVAWFFADRRGEAATYAIVTCGSRYTS